MINAPELDMEEISHYSMDSTESILIDHVLLCCSYMLCIYMTLCEQWLLLIRLLVQAHNSDNNMHW